MTATGTIGILVGLVTIATALIFSARALWRFSRRISYFLDDVNGEPARSGVPYRPGVVEQVAELRVRQEEIAKVAQTAAENTAGIRNELTRNGGSSTKDVAYQAARSAETAAAAAELAAHSAARTEALLRRHMQNGLDIMEVGQHNDLQVLAAIESMGGSVEDYRPFPPVDIGDGE